MFLVISRSEYEYLPSLEASETYLLSLEGTPKELCTAMRSTLVTTSNTTTSSYTATTTTIAPNSSSETATLVSEDAATPDNHSTQLISGFSFLPQQAASGTSPASHGFPIRPMQPGSSSLLSNLSSPRESIAEVQEE